MSTINPILSPVFRPASLLAVGTPRGHQAAAEDGRGCRPEALGPWAIARQFLSDRGLTSANWMPEKVVLKPVGSLPVSRDLVFWGHWCPKMGRLVSSTEKMTYSKFYSRSSNLYNSKLSLSLGFDLFWSVSMFHFWNDLSQLSPKVFCGNGHGHIKFAASSGRYRRVGKASCWPVVPSGCVCCFFERNKQKVR